ncbi:hypothetical protein DFH09DRAFT_1374826 [Mycena vulgaris]|nr:hypothetical protein DFH09DRAFT_1374826 [Mycena vulgaris]
MPRCKAFSAWVVIEGKKATEYGVETTDDMRRSPRQLSEGYQKTVSCYIASELGKKFAICWKNDSYPHTTFGSVTMDGSPSGGIVIYAENGTLPETVCNDGISNGKKLKPFMFSSLEITDDDTFLGHDAPQGHGTIELTIYPCRRAAERKLLAWTRSHQDDSESDDSEDLELPDIKVHEQAKKMVNQQIKVAQSQRLATPETFRVVNTEQTGPDLVKFRFQYRPLAVLQAEGIARLPRQKKRKAAAEPRLKRAATLTTDAAAAHVRREKMAAIEAKANEEARLRHEQEAKANEARILRQELAAVEAKQVKAKEESSLLREKLAAVEANTGQIHVETTPRVKREPTDGAHTVIDLTRRKRVKLEPTLPKEVIDLT